MVSFESSTLQFWIVLYLLFSEYPEYPLALSNSLTCYVFSIQLYGLLFHQFDGLPVWDYRSTWPTQASKSTVWTNQGLYQVNNDLTELLVGHKTQCEPIRGSQTLWTGFWLAINTVSTSQGLYEVNSKCNSVSA